MIHFFFSRKKMKKLIVLTGPSGVGKTTTWYPAMECLLNAVPLDTGGVFKSLFGLATSGVAPDYVLTGMDALLRFRFSEDYHRGLEEYEYAKSQNEGVGAAIIRFIECPRAVCPDLPARLTVGLLNSLPDGSVAATDAINSEELLGLRELALGHDIECYQVALNCLNPVKRGGDNRTPAGTKDALTLTYPLEDLNEKLEGFIHRIAEYIGY
jgi:hypothetical protein